MPLQREPTHDVDGPCEQNGEKRAATARAIVEIEDGMILGLGGGSIAAFAVEICCSAHREGLART